jgi:NodT family efflux transporter outer membrane factor (OMF) lipoprotein
MKRLVLPFAIVAFLNPAMAQQPSPPGGQRISEKSAPRQSEPVQTYWWRHFGDSQLEALVEAALSQNLSIEIAAARLDQASASAKAVRASLMPTVGASANAFDIRQSLEDPAIRPFRSFPQFPRDQERYGVGVSASWELDLFRSKPLRKSARASQEAFAADLEAVRSAIAAETAVTWLRLRQIQIEKGSIAKQAALLSRLEAAARAKVAAGISTANEIDKLTGDRSRLEGIMAGLDAVMAAETEKLGVLIADAETARSVVQLSQGAQPVPTLPDLETLSISLASRPDVVAAERRLLAAESGVAAAERSRLPRLSLAGLIATITSGPAALFGSASEARELGGAITFPLFDFGRIDAAIAQAKGERREAMASLRQVTLQAAADVSKTALTLAAQREEEAAQLQALRSFERIASRSRADFDAGIVDLSTLLDVEIALQVAQARFQTSQLETSKAVIDVLRSSAQI